MVALHRMAAVPFRGRTQQKWIVQRPMRRVIVNPNKFVYGVLNRNRHSGRDPVSPAYKHEMPCRGTA
jgi:hypothetical protein